MTSRNTQCRARAAALALAPAILLVAGCLDTGGQDQPGTEPTGTGAVTDDPSPQELAEGRTTFRFETFGNEAFWTDTARMHEVIERSVSPALALEVGLKLDADALPADVAKAIRAGQVDLASPATTVTLLKLDAVVGLKGTVRTVDGRDQLVELGVTCALCHSSVDDSFSPGIGRRMDGWPNGDLDIGAIIALSPAMTPEQKAVYSSWGPGKYDPRYNLDGQSTPLVLPPAYGLADVDNVTFTADGPMSYWNAYVAVTQMHGLGRFTDERLSVDVLNSPDRVGPKLAALRAYQHSLETPRAPSGSVDLAAAERGRTTFDDNCVRCHVNGTGTDNNAGALHAAAETGMDAAYALRTVNRMYRTTPLRALWQHPPYFHDGSAEALADVVEHYDRVLTLRMTALQRLDLVEYLKTL